MTREEYLNELNKAFGDFKFFPEGHYYEYKGQRVGISVTRLIEQYTNEFDSEGMAQKKSKELNITPEELLRQWKYKNDFSKAKGHTIHEFSQSLWSGEEWVYDSFDNSKEYNEVIEKLKQQAINYYNDYKDKYEFVAAEVIVGDETTDCASAIDLLLRNKITGELLLVDIKTNSYIRGYNKKAFKNPMKVPLHNLNDDAYNHYCIQLSIYKKWLIELAKLKVSEMHIVYFSENIENYEIVKVNYLKSEVERILNLRKKDRNMGKCIPILIIGKSGSGKSTSLRNLKKEEYSLVNVLNKDLPFRNGRDIKGLSTKDYEQVKNFIAKTPKNIVVVDDFGYIMTDKFVSKATETGYTKFSVIAQEFYNFIEYIKGLDGDKRVYLMMHEEKSESGDIAPKTCGKMLDNQICVEGLFSILLRCVFDGKEHRFKTTTDGLDVCKTPIDMFDSEYIDNDLKYVDDKICEYYDIKNEIKEEKKDEEK